MGLFNFLYRVILLFFFRPFKIIRALKPFGMKPNFEVRPGVVAHLALAQGHPCSLATSLIGNVCHCHVTFFSGLNINDKPINFF